LKFPTHFMQLIMVCLTLVTYNIHINGQKGDLFNRGKGLEQGNALFPLLFVLSMEYFSRLLKAASFQLKFKFYPYCKGLQLNHLIFANDVLIFNKVHPLILGIIRHTLQAFPSCTGLRVSQLKSHIVFGGCNDHLKAECIRVIGFKEASLPMRYLGIPISASGLTKIECRTLVAKITGKVKLWSSRNISFAG